MALAKYKVVQHPKSKRWYVVGLVRGNPNYYMPVSGGYKTRGEASKLMHKMPAIERDQRKEVMGI